MTTLAISSPYTQFNDIDGSPLDGGYLFFGKPGLNPKIPVNQVPIFWDSSLTQPAPQPIRTLNGYIWRNGSPANIYTKNDYSISCYDRKSRLIFYSPSGHLDPLQIDLSNPNVGTRIINHNNHTLFDVLESAPVVIPADGPGVQTYLDQYGKTRLTIAPGEYAGDFDLSITGKNRDSTGVTGSMVIDLTGVRLTGTGKIIIDGCKRIKLIGLDAPGFDLCLRGVWWSTFELLRFKTLRFGDELGTYYQANYWDNWVQCQFQRVVTGQYATYNNVMRWKQCSMRGNPGQGFTDQQTYAFFFNGNQNAQAWSYDGDISYHTDGIWTVGPDNLNGDIELHFSESSYFDTHYPKSISRARSRITTGHSGACHSANNFAGSSVMSAVARGGQNSFRQDRACGWAQHSGINMVPNGDLRIGMTAYTGAGRPIGGTGGATITEISGVGQSGRALRITQPGTSGTTLIRPKPLAFLGRHTAGLILRNADSGTRTLRVSFAGLFEVITIRSSEWTYWTLTTGADLAVGSQPDIQILSDDGTPFNIDIAYMGVTFGEGGPPMLTSPQLPQLIATSTAFFNPPNLAPGASASITIDALGAALGDFVTPSFGISISGLSLSAYVSDVNMVTVVFANNTAASVDLPSGTVRALITKPVF